MRIYSAVGLTKQDAFISSRPFRSPHHSASLIALLGGGTDPRPGEISLSHRGVLFLDEVPEYNRNVIEGLRQPLESGEVHIARARKSLTFPARFTLVLAKNPCPCGYFDDPVHECHCTAHEISRYQKKISGPLMDRIDIRVLVDRVPVEELRRRKRDENEDKAARDAVAAARGRQTKRFADIPGITVNAEMASKHVDDIVKLTPAAEQFIERTVAQRAVSARGYYKLLKIGQTIADLEGADIVDERHLSEAFQYRTRPVG